MREVASFSELKRSAQETEAALRETLSVRNSLVQDQVRLADITTQVADRTLEGAPSSLIVEDRRVQQELERRVLTAQENAQREADAVRAEQLREMHDLSQYSHKAAEEAESNAASLRDSQLECLETAIVRGEVCEHYAIAERFHDLYLHMTSVLDSDARAHALLDEQSAAVARRQEEAKEQWGQNLVRAQLIALAAASFFDPEGRGRLVEGSRPLGPWNETLPTGFYEPGGRIVLGNPNESFLVPTARAEVDDFGRVWQISPDPLQGEVRQCIGRVARNSGTIYINIPGTGIERPVARYFPEDGLIRVRAGGDATEWSGALWSRIDHQSP